MTHVSPTMPKQDDYVTLLNDIKRAKEYAKDKVNLDDQDQGGACGFAWVSISGIRKKAIKQALHDEGFSPMYPKGLSFWVSSYGQSMHCKEKFAYHMAEYLRQKTGLPFKTGSRMD